MIVVEEAAVRWPLLLCRPNFTQIIIIRIILQYLEFLYYLCLKFRCMRIVARKTIVHFYQNHSDSKIALEEWYSKTQRAEWLNSSEIKQTFNSVDSVGNDRFVFNIKGNDYRLVALILFKIKTVYVRFIGTHAEYDKTDCTKI